MAFVNSWRALFSNNLIRFSPGLFEYEIFFLRVLTKGILSTMIMSVEEQEYGLKINISLLFMV